MFLSHLVSYRGNKTYDLLESAFSVTATLVLPESGSETDDEGMSNIPPETLVFHDDDGMIQKIVMESACNCLICL